ncbi:hypothetical protein QCA50_005950 [Cerrena zonata]|uniref:Uncharacterized protein n=1 Tax=Cerrena zonata TaxID=2478898 RepID=A0AAW0GBB6_9APHY
MAGANYMGGRRNFAKARSKDVTAKAQRNHFGKQKVLSASLCKPIVSSRDSLDPSSNPIAKISLAHARQDPSVRRCEQHDSVPGPFSFMVLSPPSKPVQTIPANNRKRPRLPDSSMYSSLMTPPPGKRSSAILREMDLTEPMSLRAEMDRVRAIPDLVGLTQSYVTKRPSMRQRIEPPVSFENPPKTPLTRKHDHPLGSPFREACTPDSHAVLPKTTSRYSPSWATMSTSSGAVFSSSASDFEPMEFDDDPNSDQDDFPDSGYAEPDSPMNRLQTLSTIHSPLPTRQTLNGTASILATKQDDSENTGNSDSINWDFDKLTPSSPSPDVSSYASPFLDKTGERANTQTSNGLFVSVANESNSGDLSTPIPLCSSPISRNKMQSCLYSSSSPDSFTEETLWDLTEGHLFDSDADSWTTIKSRILSLADHTSKTKPTSLNNLSILRLTTDRRGVGYIEEPLSLSGEFSIEEAANPVKSPEDTGLHDPNLDQPSSMSHSNPPDNTTALLPGEHHLPSLVLPFIDLPNKFPQTPSRTQTSSLHAFIQDLGVASVTQSDFDIAPYSADLFTYSNQDSLTCIDRAGIDKLLATIPSMQSPPSSLNMPYDAMSSWSREGSPLSRDLLDDNDSAHRTPTSCHTENVAQEDPNSSTISFSPSTTRLRASTGLHTSPEISLVSNDTFEHRVVPGPALFSDFDDRSDDEE